MLLRGFLCSFALLCFVAPADRGGAAPAQEDLFARFETRINEYAQLRQRLSADLPSLGPSSTREQIVEVRERLAARLRSSRAAAHHGDIFEAAIERRIREIVRSELEGPHGAATRSAIMDVNPGEIPLRVNGSYPTHEPLSTVPPHLLQRLPRLPPDIDYRFVGPHMVLHDVRSNLIIDYVLDVIPPAPAAGKPDLSITLP